MVIAMGTTVQNREQYLVARPTYEVGCIPGSKRNT